VLAQQLHHRGNAAEASGSGISSMMGATAVARPQELGSLLASVQVGGPSNARKFASDIENP
jgi:hypothetical protein